MKKTEAKALFISDISVLKKTKEQMTCVCSSVCVYRLMYVGLCMYLCMYVVRNIYVIFS
jgi:hypothetical protein